MHELKGTFFDNDGNIIDRGVLLIEPAKQDGHWVDSRFGTSITAREYRTAKNMTAVMITGDFVGNFSPDTGECERVGLPVQRRRLHGRRGA